MQKKNPLIWAWSSSTFPTSWILHEVRIQMDVEPHLWRFSGLRNHLMVKMFWFSSWNLWKGKSRQESRTSWLRLSSKKCKEGNLVLLIKYIFTVTITHISGSVMEITPRFCLRLKIHGWAEQFGPGGLRSLRLGDASSCSCRLLLLDEDLPSFRWDLIPDIWASAL